MKSLDGAHYVTSQKGWWKTHHVVRVTVVARYGRYNPSVTLAYPVISRHFTRRGAERAAHRGNIAAGRTR